MLFRSIASAHSYATSLLDRGAFVVALAMLWSICREQPRPLAAYAVLGIVVPALSGTFMSYTRVLVVVFPIAIWMAMRVQRLRWWVVTPLLAAQVALLLRHTSAYWVG